MDIQSEIPTGPNNLTKEHWVKIVIGALSGYGKIDVAADKAYDAAEESSAKRLKFNLDDLDLSVGSLLSNTYILDIGRDLRLDSLRNVCVTIAQLRLDTENLFELYMSEGPSAASELIRERSHPQFIVENNEYYLENHLTTWIEELQAQNPASWDMDPKVAALHELEGLLSYEPIEYNAIKVEDNEYFFISLLI